MKTLFFYAGLWFLLLKNALIRDFDYKLTFICRALVEVIWISTQFVFFTAIFNQIGALSGWTYWEIVFFCGSMFLVDGVYMMVLYDNMAAFGRLMRMGLFDFYLLRPVSSLFLGAFRSVNTVPVVNIAIGLATCAYPILKGHIALSAGSFLLWAIYLSLGSWMVIMLGVFLISFGFWITQTQPLTWLFFELYRMSLRPDDLYTKWMRRILLSAFPAALFISVPVRLALGKETNAIWYAVPPVAAMVLTLMALGVWNKGVKKYEGAMS